jgi:hypothetical protein
MELLLSLRLRDLTSSTPKPLKAIMDEIGARRDPRLNADVLESILTGE